MSFSFDHFQKRYDALNAEQKRAVDTIDGPVLVIAGPGSGKTELLSLRVANILRLTDTHPASILCLTFTDAAAVNMRKRLAGLIGRDAYKASIHTFHSFGTEIIYRHPEYFYKGAEYRPADEITQVQLLEEILQDLKHNAALRSYHPEQGYTYLKDVMKKIGELKKGGLKPQDFLEILRENQSFLEKANPLIKAFFGERISKKMIDGLPALINDLEKTEFTSRSSHLPYQTLRELVVQSLNDAYQNALNGEKIDTKPLTEWKQHFIKKNDKSENVFGDFERLSRQFELAEIYEKYQQKLHAKGFFDFDDMLLDTVLAFEKHPELRYNFQEKYLYVLIDEFQDTNGVQMRLLDQLFDAEVFEGRPNVLAVGDDDQAIYKFQGANIANVLDFHQKYRDPALVVLQKNYRSTQEILNFARKIILKGEERLEKKIPNQIIKELESANANLDQGEIVEKDFSTALEELVFVAEKIKEKIEKENVSPSEIAVIAPKHFMLEKAAKVLDFMGVPVAYERKKNLLEQPHVLELITIVKFVHALATKSQAEADEFLPEILSFPFLGIDRIDIWKIAVQAHKRRKLWLEVMLESDHYRLSSIAEFLINLGIQAKQKTAEEIIDKITGIDAENITLDEDGFLQMKDEIEESMGLMSAIAENEDLSGNSGESFLESLNNDGNAVVTEKIAVAVHKENAESGEVFQTDLFGAEVKIQPSASKNFKKSAVLFNASNISNVARIYFRSPYKNYYFDSKKFVKNRLEYVDLLQSLQAFLDEMRAYKGQGVLTIQDVVECIELHEKHRLPLYYKSSFNSEERAVNLMTAHKAKGLEFENVFLLHCLEQSWIKGGLKDKLVFPQNIPLSPESENEEDKLRLFYVAITRAKRNLYCTRHQYDEKGMEQLRLRFLEESEILKKPKENISLEMVEVLQKDIVQSKGLEKLLLLKFKIERHQPINVEEVELLKGLLKDYKLSVTHLNNFLDLVDGGPQKFLEQNLLKFPQRMQPSGMFGNSMHFALNQFSKQFRLTKVLPDVDFLLEQFEKHLALQRLNARERKTFLEKGRDALKVYFEKRKSAFDIKDFAEFDFRFQGVKIGEAELTGKIDMMRPDNGKREMLVIDYKTGKSLKSFDFGSSYEKIKAWKYKNQLIFYKVLVENARDFFGKYKVHQGFLEFLEPVDGEIRNLDLQISQEETERMKKLIQVVYSKIMNLDFPDVSLYDRSLEGIKSFVDDLVG